MTRKRAAPGQQASSSPRRSWSRSLLIRFLLILIPLFLALAVPGVGYVVRFELRADRESLAARIGNNAARTALALSRHAAAGNPELAHSLLAPLAADRAFLCAELRAEGRSDPIAAVPPAQGCLDRLGGEELTVPVGEDGEQALSIRFSDTELREATRLQVTIALSVVAVAFLFAVLASTIGFLLIVHRPLRLLLDSIRHSTATGERKPIGLRTGDELGSVIAAFDEMLARETARETALTRANSMLRESQDQLKRLNRELEQRVRERTVDLEAAKTRAEAASDAKSRFLATVSHELRTPLNAIIGFSDVMKLEALGGLGDPRYLEFARDINANGQQLLGIINNILDIANIGSGTGVLNCRDVDAAELLAECLKTVRPVCEAAGVRLVSAAPPRPLVLHVDSERLRQALANLLGNAIKFTPSGGSVALTAAAGAGGGAEFVVEDTGIGMRPEDIPVALSPFGQIDSSLSRRYDGAGLGLPLAKWLIERHGGTLEIASGTGKGTRITVRLPGERLRHGGAAAA